MASSTRSEMLREREEERRLNMRTLVIASFASAAAAAVTSQLWIHGTWIAAALTPVLVALISEAMHRPTERIARAWTTDRPALGAGASRHADRPALADEPLRTSRATGPPGPVRVYRQPSDRSPRGRMALGVVAATAALAFGIAVAALTVGDLISGGSIGKGDGPSTFFKPTAKKKEQPQQDAKPTQTTPDQTTTTQDEPANDEPAPEEQPTDTAPTTPLPQTPPGEPAPDATP
ncbi:MAG TPA: hypothetical protein VFY47_14095 [Thermoleophilaceae bacterium]|nr:hypothetical protein [Thermoleophilaceae bacterium]